MKEKIDAIKEQFKQEIPAIGSMKELEELRSKYLGKKGLVSLQMQELRNVAPEMKREAGKWVNDLKVACEEEIQRLQDKFQEAEEKVQLANETIDVTLPGRRRPLSSKHPVQQVMDEIIDIFISMGFSVYQTPEVETEYYNFDVLNFQPDHPAKDMQDTFYIEPGVLLRTHCTTFQGHAMQTMKPPLRLINPGRCFRNEDVSMRSHVFFNQVDGLYIDEKVSFQDLVATMTEFVQKLYHKEVPVRFRTSYFPFVEPGTEVDVQCVLCAGSGCSVCKHTGWLEILGAGMVHPEVLRNCGIDPEKYSGYAWGMGVERQAMLRYGINDIRLFSENDMRFLNQFVQV
ncbi:MAG TPA: phenylalanine--tRNA ligase subunit alpha [Chlamydiales bacterium]|nr:phenylalanine--tRNA ligase subunit alpha [Chlamydiales bacterium]